jgi:hypothetical protein
VRFSAPDGNFSAMGWGSSAGSHKLPMKGSYMAQFDGTLTRRLR